MSDQTTDSELREFAQWLVSMDDPEDVHGREQRRAVTLTAIIDRARSALAAHAEQLREDDPDVGTGAGVGPRTRRERGTGMSDHEVKAPGLWWSPKLDAFVGEHPSEFGNYQVIGYDRDGWYVAEEQEIHLPDDAVRVREAQR